jgi:hypothetical protein
LLPYSEEYMNKTIALWLPVCLMLTACGTSPATTVAATLPEGNAPTATSSAGPSNPGADLRVAANMAGLLYTMDTVQSNTEADVTAMAKVTVGSGNATALRLDPVFGGALASLPLRPLVQIENVPQGFLAPLPESGAIQGEPGSCGAAAANPAVTFMTTGGQAVTPGLLSGMQLQTLPKELVILAQDDPNSLLALINTLIKQGDPRFATAAGWNELLWDQLKNHQEPARSLMDYQLWNASPEIEQTMVDLLRAQLVQMGVPQIVLDAYDASEKTGWYANAQPTADDALAQMQIQAEMTGSINGTVHEQRDFTIPGAGEVPTYGVQTGTGTVTWDAPGLGTLTFDVKIRLDQFDERGHAVGGIVTGIDADEGYTVTMTFQPDGSRKGEILRNGQPVGLLNMTVNESKFENYLDLSTNQNIPLPNP